MVTADFNNDGHQDLAVANVNNLGVLLGAGNGTFSLAATYGTGSSSPNSIAVGDFNRDGREDLAFVSNSSVGVLLGAGDGTFGSPSFFGPRGGSLVVGDFNDDGSQDLAFTAPLTNGIGVMLGVGDGTFPQTATYSPRGTEPLTLAVGEFDGDGSSDLVVANYGSNNLGVLLGAGNGTFGPTATYGSGGNNPWSVAVGDLNRDGRQDLVVANIGSSINDVGVLLGSGNGGFGTAAAYSSEGSSPTSIVVADFNGDGKQDFAATNDGPNNNVGIRLGVGDGTFVADPIYGSGGTSPRWAATGDFNGDGRQDLAVVNYNSGGSTSSEPARHRQRQVAVLRPTQPAETERPS